MNDVNMAEFTAPKTDQLNADSLIGGPITVTITGVRGTDNAEQPVAISYQGDDGKPFKPCKSMRRVMVNVWGADAKKYIGRSLTLYCDPGVQFGGMKVGGIRISHMSHIDKAQTMALTATRAKRAPFTVQPLEVVQVGGQAAALIQAYKLATTKSVWDAIEADRATAWPKMPAADKLAVKEASESAFMGLTDVPV